MEIIRQHIEDGIVFSTDKSKLDIPFTHGFLTRSYWAEGIPIGIVEASIENSLAVGVYSNERQIGFARVITDYATFAYLADVFVDEGFRSRGISKKLMSFILSFEEFSKLRRFILATRDAHTLYARYGFKPLKSPERFMERHHADVYKNIR